MRPQQENYQTKDDFLSEMGQYAGLKGAYDPMQPQALEEIAAIPQSNQPLPQSKGPSFLANLLFNLRGGHPDIPQAQPQSQPQVQPQAQGTGLVKGGTQGVADYQQKLKDGGFYDGAIDGAWGPKTESAYARSLDAEQIGQKGVLNTQGNSNPNAALNIANAMGVINNTNRVW